MSIDFEWKRFWCSREGAINLSDGGFLSDPEGEWGKVERLSDLDCVALLGEPGIGKTRDLQRQISSLESSVISEGGRLISVDLRSFASEDRLMKFLFESEEFRLWRQGDYPLHLFLDSLDECLLRIDNVASLLADELPKQPIDRLRIRIACRTAVWPGILETALTRLFPEFRAYEMSPLRRVDVRNAAERSGVPDPGAFLDRIQALDVTSLAIKPITLNFLIRTYLRDGNFPTNPIDLYESGCRILCEEPNESRIGSGRIGRLSPDERLAIAARIATITQLANRYAVYFGSESEGVPPEDVPIGDIAGATESGPNDVTVSIEAIREVLDTGLFSSRGPNRLGWAHQTYSEFLAALYCQRHSMPVEQVRSLIFHPEGRNQQLVPQLRELAGWMSVMNPQVLKIVAGADPEALLGAAAASLSDIQRNLLVKSILDQCAVGRALHLRWDMFALYRKLRHAGLEDQLRPYLRDKSKPIGLRHVAADIARASRTSELGSDLADIALDLSEDASLRAACATAAADIGSAKDKSRLRPLAFGQAGADPDDELKGSGLAALWPEFITMAEILPLVSPPKQRSLHGAYASFLDYQFPLKMETKHLPAALEWFSHQARDLGGPFDRLMDSIVQAAWENLDHAEVAKGLAQAVLSRMTLDDSLMSGVEHEEFNEKVERDDKRRRTLLAELLPQLQINRLGCLMIIGVPLLITSDVEWLIRRILSEESPSSAQVEAKLVSRLFDWRSRESFDQLYAGCQSNEILNSECGHFFAPIPLDSEQAKTLRENLEQEKAWKKARLLDPPPPPDRIERDLRNIEAGNIDDWMGLVFDLSLEPTSELSR
jgi:hypothetical protein